MGFPTIDRPFGASLWTLLDNAYVATIAEPAADFRIVPGKIPMTTLSETFLALTTYYFVIFGGQQLMKGLPAFQLQTAFIIHNFYLTVISTGLLLLFIEQIVPTIYYEGVFFSICDARGGWTSKLVLLYYVCYHAPRIDKFLLTYNSDELLDKIP
jgi:hypothetical protein